MQAANIGAREFVPTTHISRQVFVQCPDTGHVSQHPDYTAARRWTDWGHFCMSVGHHHFDLGDGRGLQPLPREAKVR